MAPFCNKQRAIKLREVMPFFQIHSPGVTVKSVIVSTTRDSLQSDPNESSAN